MNDVDQNGTRADEHKKQKRTTKQDKKYWARKKGGLDGWEAEAKPPKDLIYQNQG